MFCGNKSLAFILSAALIATGDVSMFSYLVHFIIYINVRCFCHETWSLRVARGVMGRTGCLPAMCIPVNWLVSSIIIMLYSVQCPWTTHDSALPSEPWPSPETNKIL